MFALGEGQLPLQEPVRGWCEKELAPAVPAMERGETLPCELLRALLEDFGLAELLVGPAQRRIAQLRLGKSTPLCSDESRYRSGQGRGQDASPRPASTPNPPPAT